MTSTTWNCGVRSGASRSERASAPSRGSAPPGAAGCRGPVRAHRRPRAQVHGSPSLTGDVDICFALDRDNLRHLAEALASLTAIRRGMPTEVSAPLDDRALRAGDVFALSTRYGDLDLLAHPEPGLDFETLLGRSITAEILGVPVRVAGLDDLMAMKRAAGRPKDRIELEILGALREEIDRRG